MTKNKSIILNKTNAILPFLDKPVEIFKLANGHTIVIANKKGDLLNISTWVKTGSINEDDQITGVSHFLEHLMFKGTPNHPAGEFDRTLESKGAIVNAATWKDFTYYYVTLPKGNDDKNFDEVLDLHADMMLNASLPEEEIGPAFDISNPDVKEKRERYVVIEEIGMRNDQPWSKTYNELNHIMYTVHPYKRDVIGNPETIASLSRQAIIDYYKKWYTPKNMTTIIVGDLDTKEALDKIITKFQFNEKPHKIELNYEEEPVQSQIRYVENISKINTGFGIFGFHAAKASDLKETIALDVISIILGEGKSSRLYQNLIEKSKKHIFNVVSSGQYQFKEGNTFFIQVNFIPNKKEKAIELLKKELRNIIDFPITQEELDKARKKLKSRFAEESETVSHIGELIGHYMTVCEDISCYTDYLKSLETLTIQDIFEITRKYIDMNKLSISILMPDNDLA